MIWLDVHDLPVVRALNVLFFENYNAPCQEVRRPSGASRWQAAGLRAGTVRGTPGGAPFAYKGAEAAAAIRAAGADAFDPYDGMTLDYVNPLTGGATLPTIACRLHLWRDGHALGTHRHTASTIYHVVTGAGVTQAGEKRLSWSKGDTFVVPGWTWHSHAAHGADALVFSVSDAPILAAIGHLRTESAAKNGKSR